MPSARDIEHLLERAAARAYQRIETDGPRAAPRAARILAFLRTNLFHPALNVKRLREELEIGDNGISSVFRTAFGETIHDYIESRRLETACELLAGTRLRVSHVARLVGYRSAANLGLVFERRLGCRPMAYRQRSRTQARIETARRA